jgi:hypothetical protein
MRLPRFDNIPKTRFDYHVNPIMHGGKWKEVFPPLRKALYNLIYNTGDAFLNPSL